MKTDIKDQTLAMYLEQVLGVKVEYPATKNRIHQIAEAITPGSTITFFFQIPAALKRGAIIRAIQDYFRQTDKSVKLGEYGSDLDYPNDFFWIFEDRHETKDGEYEYGTSIRCQILGGRIFYVD